MAVAYYLFKWRWLIFCWFTTYCCIICLNKICPNQPNDKLILKYDKKSCILLPKICESADNSRIVSEFIILNSFFLRNFLWFFNIQIFLPKFWVTFNHFKYFYWWAKNKICKLKIKDFKITNNLIIFDYLKR